MSSAVNGVGIRPPPRRRCWCRFPAWRLLQVDGRSRAAATEAASRSAARADLAVGGAVSGGRQVSALDRAGPWRGCSRDGCLAGPGYGGLQRLPAHVGEPGGQEEESVASDGGVFVTPGRLPIPAHLVARA